MTHDLTDPIYNDPDAARAHLEKQRWPDGAVCPHCGSAAPDRVYALKGKAHRPGLYQCNDCLQQFTVTVGTVFERSKIPLHKWVLATHLLGSSKKGMSSHQLHRMLGITYKTAWFMTHRIREAMKDLAPPPMGGGGKTVEADETYFGKQEDPQPTQATKAYTKGGKSGPAGKRAVVALVERGGSARTFHVEAMTATEVRNILVTNVYRSTSLHTDESRLYTEVGREYWNHRTVRHSSGEYVKKGQPHVHTNTVEGCFSVFKRGMKGVYQRCAEKHLHRYLTEFDFRHNTRTALGFTDTQRRDRALSQIGGKRLTYRSPDTALVQSPSQALP